MFCLIPPFFSAFRKRCSRDYHHWLVQEPLTEDFNQPKTNASFSQYAIARTDEYPSVNLTQVQCRRSVIYLFFPCACDASTAPWPSSFKEKLASREKVRSIKHARIPISGNTTLKFNQQSCPTSPASFQQG